MENVTDLSTLSKKALGALAEDITAEYIKNMGGEILHRNYTTPYGEVDIIAKMEDGVIALIEVKCRRTASRGTPQEAVSKAKQRRYAYCAAAYLSTLPEGAGLRFDVSAVTVKNNTFQINYTPNAFDMGQADFFY